MPDATAKICIICRQDCSNRPRVKDARGRYLCKSCEQARAQRQTVPAGAAASPGPDSDPDSNPFDLMPDSLLSDGPAPCPACNQPIPAGSVLCLHCGFDVRKGAKLLTGTGVDDPDDPSSIPVKGKPAAAKCPDCGYDLTGLKSPRCPECGKLVVKKGYREKLQEDARATARWEYLRPLIMLGIGLGGIAIFHLARFDTEQLIGTLIGLAITVPSGVVAFWLLCLVWLGFDAPIRLTALRLAGIFAITELADTILALTGIPILIWPVSFFLYYGLLMQELDLEDWKDALVLTLLMKGIAIAAVLGLAYLLSGP